MLRECPHGSRARQRTPGKTCAGGDANRSRSVRRILMRRVDHLGRTLVRFVMPSMSIVPLSIGSRMPAAGRSTPDSRTGNDRTFVGTTAVAWATSLGDELLVPTKIGFAPLLLPPSA